MSEKNNSIGGSESLTGKNPKHKAVRSHSLGLGDKGIQDAEEARQFLYAVGADIGSGSVDPDRAHPIARMFDVAAKTHANQLKEREIALRERDQARRFKLLGASPVKPKRLSSK